MSPDTTPPAGTGPDDHAGGTGGRTSGDIHVRAHSISGPTAVGHTVHQHVTTSSAGADLTALRDLLARAAPELADAAEDADRPQVEADLEAVRRELDREQPRPAAVRSRWQSIMAMLGDVTRLGTDVAQIAEVIGNLPA